MNIISHGIPFNPIRTYKFHCISCGCVYTAEEQEIHYSSENTYPRYKFTYCPDCKHKIPVDYAEILKTDIVG